MSCSIQPIWPSLYEDMTNLIAHRQTDKGDESSMARYKWRQQLNKLHAAVITKTKDLPLNDKLRLKIGTEALSKAQIFDLLGDVSRIVNQQFPSLIESGNVSVKKSTNHKTDFLVTIPGMDPKLGHLIITIGHLLPMQILGINWKDALSDMQIYSQSPHSMHRVVTDNLEKLMSLTTMA